MKFYVTFSLMVAAILTAYAADAFVTKCYTCGWSTGNPCSESKGEEEIETCQEVSDHEWMCGEYIYMYDNGTVFNRKGCFPYRVGGREICYDYNDEFDADNLINSDCGWCAKELCNCKKSNVTADECMF